MERVDPQAFKDMATALKESCARHRERYEDEAIIFARRIETEYLAQLNRILLVLIQPGTPLTLLSPAHGVLAFYLDRMEWVGWGNCEFGPPLGIRYPEEEYALSILVYLSARLMDDGIDGHPDYKGKVPNLYGHLIQKFDAGRAGGLSTLMGGLVMNGALRRLLKKGYTESADALMALYSEVFPGALAEALRIGTAIPEDLYRTIVRRKSVAYDMMLHRVFFRRVEPALRSRILQFLAGYSETAQWLNDLCDEKDDLARGQLNILAIPGMDQETAFMRIVSSIFHLWRSICDLPLAVRDVMALRLYDSIKKFKEIPCDPLYKEAVPEP